MTQLRHSFIESLELKGFSPRTVQNYVQVVAKLSKFYNCSPLELSKQQIKDYFCHHIKNKLLAPRSINLHIGALKTLCNKELDQYGLKLPGFLKTEYWFKGSLNLFFSDIL